MLHHRSPSIGPFVSLSCNHAIFVSIRPIAPTKTLFQAFCSQEHRDLEAQSVLVYRPPSRGPLLQFLATKAFWFHPD